MTDGRHSAYKAIQKPVLFGGVSTTIIGIELIAAVLLFKAMDDSWWLAGGFLMVTHNFISWLFKRDHLIVGKLQAYLSQPDSLYPGRTRRLPPGFGGLL